MVRKSRKFNLDLHLFAPMTSHTNSFRTASGIASIFHAWACNSERQNGNARIADLAKMSDRASIAWCNIAGVFKRRTFLVRLI